MNDRNQGYNNPGRSPSYLDSEDFRRGQRARLMDDERYKKHWEELGKGQSDSYSSGSQANTQFHRTYSLGSTVWDTAKAFAILGAVFGALIGYFSGTDHIAYVCEGTIAGALAGWMTGAVLFVAVRVLRLVLRIAIYAIGIVLLVVLLLSFLR